MHKTFKDGLHGAGSERTVWVCVGGVGCEQCVDFHKGQGRRVNSVRWPFS